MHFFRHIIPALFPFFLILAIALMSYHLEKSLRKTLYAHKNIELTAAILFTTVFTVIFSRDAHLLRKSGEEVSLRFIFKRLVAFPKAFSGYAVAVLMIMAVLLTVSNIALIRHEGLRPKNVLGIALSIAYVGGTFLAYYLSDVTYEKILLENGLEQEKNYVIVHTFLSVFVLILLCYFECILAGTAFMGLLAANQKPTYDRDFIIIPGCAISKKGGLLPLLKGRVAAAIHYVWEQEIHTGKPVCYVPSGGQGADEVMSEGSAMELFLLSKGAESFEIFPEKESKNTYENFLFSKKIIDSRMPDAKVAFATTNYHMLRCGLLAQETGLDAEGIANGTKWYFWPNGFVREFIAILAMHRKAHIAAAGIFALSCIIMAGIAMHL